MTNVLLENTKTIFGYISEGEINLLKDVYLTKEIIETIFYHEFQIKPISNVTIFPEVSNINMINYAILCERSNILDYFITNFNVSLNTRCNGWTSLHFASCTNNYDCMVELLGYKSIYDDIGSPVDQYSCSLHDNPSWNTNVFHICCTNRKHAQALLLAFNLVDIKDGDRTDSKRVKGKCSNLELISQLSKSGNSTLHMSASLNDWDMCQILLHAGIDKDILNSQNQTPADIAKKYGHLELARKLKNKVQLEPLDALIDRYLSILYLCGNDVPTSP